MGNEKTRVLVADDDPHILSMLSTRLGKRGYDVLEAADGIQAVETAKRELPDLIVLDVMMPGKSGWEVARELRKDERTRGIGILILTAIGESMNELSSPLYGADDYLDKPFEFADLEQRIQRILDARTAKRGE
ncbi:MAG: response regulator [Myxococcales bacterium]|nr:response regulator [Myxococcales bacterium]